MFSKIFLIEVRLSKTALKGRQAYMEGKNKLEVAIRESDESVMHLTAQVVSSIFLPGNY